MTEALLRVTYLALGIYTFASALLTTSNLMSSSEVRSPVELFSIGSMWVSFLAFVLIVGWASKYTAAKRDQRLSESLLRASFLSMGLLFFTCAFATTVVLGSAVRVPSEVLSVGGLWLSFLIFTSMILLAQRGTKHSADPAGVSA